MYNYGAFSKYYTGCLESKQWCTRSIFITFGVNKYSINLTDYKTSEDIALLIDLTYFLTLIYFVTNIIINISKLKCLWNLSGNHNIE